MTVLKGHKWHKSGKRKTTIFLTANFQIRIQVRSWRECIDEAVQLFGKKCTNTTNLLDEKQDKINCYKPHLRAIKTGSII